jgi:Bacterial Ig domain
MFFFHPAPHDHHADLPARHDRPGRSLLPVLCLAAVTVLGGILTAPVAATSQPAPPGPTDDKPVEIPEGKTTTLVLAPADETVNENDAIWLGESRTYRATVVVTVGPNKAAAGHPDRESQRRDVTGQTTFKVKEGPNSVDCQQATCTPTTAGTHIVEGEYTVEGEGPTSDDRLLTGTTTLRVRQPVERLLLLPPDRTIRAGNSQRYRAIGLTKDGQRLGNVTRKTSFTVTKADGGPPIPCRRSLCSPTKAGDYTVNGTLREDRREPVTGTANLTVVPGEPETLRLEPVTASVEVGVEQQFEAIGEDQHGNEMDLTEPAEFTIVRKDLTTADGGSCIEAGNVATCKGAGPDTTYVVTASLPRSRLSADATLIVLPEPIDPSIYSVTPRSGSPNTEVVVKGTTGSCGRVGRLTLVGTRVRARVVRNEFETRFKVPSGTAPGDYQLLLEVTCENKEKEATRPFKVDNRSPEPVDDSDVTLQDQAVSIPVTRNDRDPDDPDGYPTVLAPGAPQDGTTENQRNRRIRYTPDKGFKGTDHFQYRLCDVVAPGKRQCGTATVTVTVNPPEPKPVDDPDEQTRRDRAVVIDVMGNDTHPDASRLRVKDQPTDGEAEKLPDGHVEYTPDPGFTGIDRFTYDYCGARINAAGTAASCPTATVTVTVTPDDPRPVPEPVDDPDAETRRDQPVTIDVMANDHHPDLATLRVKDQPDHGAAEKLPGGAIRYAPDQGFTDVDQFTYDYCGEAPGVTRRAACPSATVTVTVEPPPPPPPPEPQPVDDPGQTTARDQPVVLNVMANDHHPDLATLRVKDQPDHGAAEKLADGTVRYTPDPGRVGEDSFRYDYCGAGVDAAGAAGCPSATVTVTVTSDPVITSIRPDSTAPGKPVKVAGSTGSCGRSGTLTLEETGATAPVTADQRGNFSADLTVPQGVAPRTYTLALGVACRGQTQRAEASLTVTNQAPEAADDVATTARDHPVEVEVTENDRDPDDPDGYPTRLLAGPPIYGTAEVRSDDVIVYTPGPDFVGQDQFQYSLCDNILNADCGPATVTVSVTDTPAITSVSPAAAKPGTPVIVTGSTGSCDRRGTLTVEETGMVAQVAGEQNGNFATVLTVPVGTFPGDYRLALRVDCNGTAQQAETTLSVANEAPQAEDDEADTVSGSAVSIPVVDNDRDPDDPDGYPTLLLLTKAPDHGTAEVQTERTILYTPEPGRVGRYQFRYSLCDDTLNAAGHADCGHATVTVNVADDGRCLTPDVSSLRVDPGKGRGGARLGITATVDRKLRACPFRLMLGETPLGPDVRAGDDGGITAQRQVPANVTPGTIPLRLATMRGDVLAQAPFEITRPWPWMSNPFVRGVLGMAALLVGGLVHAGWRRWWHGGDERKDDLAAPVENVRTRVYAGPAEVATERVRDGTRTFAVRLEPHGDPGTPRLEEEEEP